MPPSKGARGGSGERYTSLSPPPTRPLTSSFRSIASANKTTPSDASRIQSTQVSVCPSPPPSPSTPHPDPVPALMRPRAASLSVSVRARAGVSYAFAFDRRPRPGTTPARAPSPPGLRPPRPRTPRLPLKLEARPLRHDGDASV